MACIVDDAKKQFFHDSLSIPINSLNEVPLLQRALKKTASDIDSFQIPSVKLGLYVEVLIIAEISANLEVYISTNGKFSYSFGRRHMYVFANGRLSKVNKGFRTLKSEQPAKWKTPILPQSIPLLDTQPFLIVDPCNVIFTV